MHIKIASVIHLYLLKIMTKVPCLKLFVIFFIAVVARFEFIKDEGCGLAQ